jgi:hypothetical protein
MSGTEITADVADQIAKLVEARMDDSPDSLRDVVEVMQAIGIGKTEPTASILARADDQLARGRGQQALIAKAVPDMAFAYDLHMGNSGDDRIGPHIRHLVYSAQPQLGFVELTYLLEEHLYAAGLAE